MEDDIDDLNGGVITKTSGIICIEDLSSKCKSVCKIYKEGLPNNGFFLKFTHKNILKKFLVTSSHIIDQIDIDYMKTIKISNQQISEGTKIILDQNERKIYTLPKDTYDSTFIEILSSDNIPEQLFLEVDDSLINGVIDNYNNQQIIMIQSPLCQRTNFSLGSIVRIEDDSHNYRFIHNASTCYGSAGAPILLSKSLNVIGLNQGNLKDKKDLGRAVFIQDIIDEIFSNDTLDQNNINKMIMVYNIKDISKKTQIFGEVFCQKNKDKCRLEIDGINSELISKYKFDSIGKHEISIFNDDNDIIDMSQMFHKCEDLISVLDVSKWITNKVTNFSEMFSECISLCSLPDLSKWITNKVNNMSKMFNKCISLSSLPDISIWKTHNVNDMSEMFNECKSLTSLPDISKWNISNVNNMNYMFYECVSLTSFPDISKWDIYNVHNMSGMFAECHSLNKLPDISKWNTSNVYDMSGIFYNCANK